MNNKRLGNSFEQYMCGLLQRAGFWVHFISPSHAGSQPFDLIAAYHSYAFAIECKTVREGSVSFPLSRLEENQRLALHKWHQLTNFPALIAVGRPQIRGRECVVECGGERMGECGGEIRREGYVEDARENMAGMRGMRGKEMQQNAWEVFLFEYDWNQKSVQLTKSECFKCVDSLDPKELLLYLFTGFGKGGI